ncbi:MAG: cytochrome c3 family protein [Nitrospirae bacterium]|nr:cytochrome c3 family protein [Nitrospirota bacterium]
MLPIISQRRTTGSYAGIAQDNCNACHAANYQSAPNHVSSAYPRTCTSCHSTTGSWSNVTAYTHTGFTFTGAHSALRTICSECHITGKTIPAGTTNNSCNNCHSTAGVATTKYESVTSISHITNNFSRTCTDCHTNTSWTPARFTHRVFQLSGAHTTLACNRCHTNGYPGSMAGITSDNCNACHSANYQAAPNHVAASYPRTCTSCHSNTTWSGATVMHQNFQFLYRHGTLSCSACHQSGYPGQYAGVSETDCYACHASDYREEHTTCSHTCTNCHNGNNWDNPRSKNGCN